jgi:hypothetical protein
MSDITQYQAKIKANGVSDTGAAIEALEANPHVMDASEHPSLHNTVIVTVWAKATNLSVGTEYMAGTVRGQLEHYDIDYGVNRHGGDAVNVLISGKATSIDAEQPTNESEA